MSNDTLQCRRHQLLHFHVYKTLEWTISRVWYLPLLLHIDDLNIQAQKFLQEPQYSELSFHIQVGDIALEEQSAIFKEKNHVICSLHIFTSF